MVRLRSVLLAGVLVTLVEAALGVYAVSALGPVKIALYPLACAAATGTVTGVGAYLMSRRRRGDGGGGRDGGGEGPQPPWWPRFEAEFRRHVREREREATRG